MAQYTQIVRFMQVFGRGKRKKTGGHLMYRTPALNHYLITLISLYYEQFKSFIRQS
jgi:hypothetical protein